MCRVKWTYCNCCWNAMKKKTESRCPSVRWCRFDRVRPVECWWKRCKKCTDNCPVFEDCRANLPVTDFFFVRRGTENPKFSSLVAAVDCGWPEGASGTWKWNWRRFKFCYNWDESFA